MPTVINPQDYVLVGDRVKPDLAGEVGGVKVKTRDGKQYVSMTPAQAQYFLEHGVIRLWGTAAPHVDKPAEKPVR